MTSYTAARSTAWRRGWIVFIILAVLTAIEFIVSLTLAAPLPYLTVIALTKAALIVVYFMRVRDLAVVWREEVRESKEVRQSEEVRK